VWFDAVIGYLSASVEWAELQGDPDAWKTWWLTEPGESRHAYFMGKDNIVFHSFLWPAMLAAYDGPLCDRPDGAHVPLHRPDDIVASEFLTMEGRKFSSSRQVVIYVRDVLDRYGPDPLRFSLTAGAPETGDADFTWAEFVRRNNDELVATWGNLVQRVCAMLRRNGGVVPGRDGQTDEGRAVVGRVAAGFGTVGDLIERYRFKNALNECLLLAQEVNVYVSQSEPWKVVKEDPDQALAILSAAYDAVCDLNVLFTPFLPHGAQRVWDNLGAGVTVPLPEESVVGEGDDAHRVLRTPPGDLRWEPFRVAPGTPLGPQSPLFGKIDTDVVEKELARLAESS
jgi:methionyl-tRNA synthetase